MFQEKTIGFEVELSRERSARQIIPKVFKGLKFSNYESAHIVEYNTRPILLEDWRSILGLARNVYYSVWGDFDLSNKAGSQTKRGESLHFHIPYDIIRYMEIPAVVVSRNLIPLMGRAFEFRETIRERAKPECNFLSCDSKGNFITYNSQNAEKPATLELRINESLLGGWFTALVLSNLEDLSIDLHCSYDFWELKFFRTDYDAYYRVNFADFEAFVDYLKNICEQLQRKYQHNEVVWYFLNRLPSMVARERKGWERRLLEILYEVKDRKFQKLLINFEKKDKKIQDGYWPNSFAYYIKLF